MKKNYLVVVEILKNFSDFIEANKKIWQHFKKIQKKIFTL